MKRLLEDLELQGKYELPSGDWEAKTNKIRGVLRHGSRFKWYYREDIEFAKHINSDPRDMAPYSGLIVSVPDVEFSSSNTELDIEQCVVIIDTYPTEKCGPECEWIALGRLLDNEDLIEMFNDNENR